MTYAIYHLASAIERLGAPIALPRNHYGTPPVCLIVIPMREPQLFYKGAHQQAYERFETVRLATETLTLERTLGDLVNQAYALTPAEIELMWKTAPPRMPIPAPCRNRGDRASS